MNNATYGYDLFRLIQAHEIREKKQLIKEQEFNKIKEDKSVLKGMLFASIFSIPIWFLIIQFVIWLF